MVFGIVESYKGTITVQSTLGKGSIFTIWFPTILSYQTEEETFTTNCEKGCEKILLVDDEPELLGMLKKMLSSLGYEVFDFIDSQNALDAFEKEPSKFNLVLTDLTMPKLNGVDLAKSVKAIRKDIQVILCTGYSNEMTQEELAAFKIDFLLFKPIVKSDISKTIRLALDKEVSSKSTD